MCDFNCPLSSRWCAANTIQRTEAVLEYMMMMMVVVAVEVGVWLYEGIVCG